MHAGDAGHTRLSSHGSGMLGVPLPWTLPETALASWGQGWGHSGSHHLLLLHGQASSPFLGKHPAPLWQTCPHQCDP